MENYKFLIKMDSRW